MPELQVLAIVIAIVLAIVLAVTIVALMFAAIISINRRLNGKPNGLAVRAQRVMSNPGARNVGALAVMALLTFGQFVVTHAQSVGINFSADDLNIFFTWFNTMFEALLPIALLGAGIAAGGMFVWVIGRMLVRAFANMMGGGMG